MNKTPKVSVVVPVYNTETYVRETLQSVLGQTLHDLEIIVVNDGSTDGSLSVIEELARQDDRIIVVSQQNKGLSEARNAGMDCAHGEFIHFMDSDDLLEADAFERCYELCTAERLDFVFFDAVSFGAPVLQAAWLDYRRARHFNGQVWNGCEALNRMLDLHCFRASACLSFIRTSYLHGLSLRFQPGILHEDELFTPQLYIGAARIRGIERTFFHRRVREGSIMDKTFSERNLTGYVTVLHEMDRLRKNADRPIRKIICRLEGRILHPVTANAWQLPLAVRWQLARRILLHYPRHFSLRSMCTLLFKSPIRKLQRR